MKSFLKQIIPSLTLLLPALSFAQTTSSVGQSFRDVVKAVVMFISGTVIPTLTGIAFLVVIYNLVQFIARSDNDQERAKFKGYTIWSLVAFFVFLAIFGIIQIFSTTIFNGSAIVIPQFPTS